MATEVTISAVPDDEWMRRWFHPLLEHGTTFCAPNLVTTPVFLRAPNVELPLSVNDTEWENSWICSPLTHYVTYAKEEITRATGKGTAWVAGKILSGIGAWFQRTDFNRVVMVNNWLLSTNPWPKWEAKELPEVLEALIKRWPDRAIIFRSLNRKESAPLIDGLQGAGARLVPSRQVWWYEADSKAVSQSRDFRKDVAILKRDDLEVVPHETILPSDFDELTALYDQLYLEKYSRHNPQFTEAWFRHLHSENLARFTALRSASGRFVGIEGCSAMHGVLTSPIVGYDLTEPQSLGLYRRLAALPILEARRLGLPLNLSAGVGRYKALRGGEAVMEYLGVYDRHLPLKRRLPWQCIDWLSTRMLAPYVQRHGL